MEDGNSVLRICLFFLKGGSLLRNMLLTAGNVEYRTLNFETCPPPADESDVYPP
jgi:hypothetical protein